MTFISIIMHVVTHAAVDLIMHVSKMNSLSQIAFIDTRLLYIINLSERRFLTFGTR